MSKNIAILIIFYFLLYPFYGCNDRGNMEEKIVGSINGEKIFLREVEGELNDFIKRFNDIKPLKKTEMDDLKYSVLGKLIEKKILFQETKRLNISVSDKELDERVKDILGDYSSLRLKEILERNGMTFQVWKAKIRENIIIEKLIEQEVNSKIVLSEKELADYYNAFPDKFMQPLYVHALQIVVETESEARAIRKRIIKGADFAEAAKTESLSPDRKKGGDLGFFSKGQMPKEFDNVVFNLNVGEISEVVQTPYGYHIFKVLEKREAKKIDFFEAREKIKKELVRQKQKANFLKWINQLKDNADIVISYEDTRL